MVFYREYENNYHMVKVIEGTRLTNTFDFFSITFLISG